MVEEQAVSKPGVREELIEDELRVSYLRYSMSVIVSRALPDVRDGLKPVHRRVLMALRDLNLTPRAKYRKCAKIVGECMGNYHPHGDASIYDTLVRMAQPWSLRYMLVDGWGNFGSIDNDPPAAMRYTEARMAKPSEELLMDIDKDTVDFQPNYDESLQEPTVLPCKFPNLLVNGSTGIAVGMATNMPPHNMTEVCKALIKICDDPDVSVSELMKIIKGPDFPTGGMICGMDGIHSAFTTGRGKITVRSTCHIETKKGDRQNIIITEIPYQVTKDRLIEGIANGVKDGKIEGISAIHDYSGRDGINISIELKRGEDPDVVLNNLYKRSMLQVTFGIINIALVDNKPQVLTVKEMLQHYRDHRFDVIRRRTLYLLNKAEARAHILEGLLKAIDHIDEVIKIIRGSATVAEAKQTLIARFELSDVQCQAILDMPLRRLTGLERDELQNEFDDLMGKIMQYKAILADSKLVYDMIREDAHEMIDKYGDERRTQIVAAAEDITIEDLIAEEEMAVCITHGGYIKRMPLDTYRKQGRGGKGISGMKFKEDDFIEHLFTAITHDYILFFTNQGQLYWLKVYDIPEMSRGSRGRSLANVIQLKKDETISSMIPVRTFDDDKFLTMATKRGVIKKTTLSAFKNPTKAGIRAINLDTNDELIGVVMTNGAQNLMLATREGMACHFVETDVRPMGRPARGVGGIRLKGEDEVVSLVAQIPNAAVLTITENGMGKRSEFEDYRLTKRGAQGVINLKKSEKTGAVVMVMSVMEEDEVMIMTREGMVVRIPVNSIRVIGRATQGVMAVRLNEPDKVVAVASVIGGKDEEDKDGGEGEDSSEEAVASSADVDDVDEGDDGDYEE